MYNDDKFNENQYGQQYGQSPYINRFPEDEYSFQVTNGPVTSNRPREKYISRKAAAIIMAICMIFSMAIGFLGGYLGQNVSFYIPKLTEQGDNNNKAGQDVINNSKDAINNENTGDNSTETGNYKQVVQTSDSTATAGRKALTIPEVVNKTAHSVVEITTEVMTTANRIQQYIKQGAGSGVIVSEDGFIVTNNHVIDGASKIVVKLKSGESFDAKVIATDPKTDLAVIKIDKKGLNAAVFGDSSKIQVGETAIAIGNPLGQLGGTVTAGIISALDREILIDNETMTLLQTDASVNPGNSGGALVNIYGEVIGIVNAKSFGEDIEGLGFAIPSNTVKKVVNDLINYGYVRGRIEVGLSLVEINSRQMAMMYRVNEYGVYVLKVNKGSAAEEAGFVAGDRIVKIDDVEIKSIADIKKLFDSHKVNDIVNVVVDRGTQKTLKLRLSEYKPS